MSLSSLKKPVFVLLRIAAVLLACYGALIGGVLYVDWSAERHAKALCDDIAIGSDISLAVAKSKDKNHTFGDEKRYSFYFPGFVFDKAVCEVLIDANRKVTSKHSEMEYD